MDKTYLTTTEAALITSTPATMHGWRFSRQGPPYRKFGRMVRYHRQELLAWAARRRHASTGADTTP